MNGPLRFKRLGAPGIGFQIRSLRGFSRPKIGKMPSVKILPCFGQSWNTSNGNIGISLAIYRGQKASPWKTLKKSEKGFPGPRRPRGQKKRLEKESKITIFQVFRSGFWLGFLTRLRLLSDMLPPRPNRTCCPRGREAPATQTFSGVFHGEAFLTPVDGDIPTVTLHVKIECDENDENGGCHSGKRLKTTICQKHRFRHPG